MSQLKTFLLADSAEHAAVLDKLVLAALNDQGVYGGAWSEVWTDGQRFGIFWGSPVSGIFGYPPSEEHPEGDPAMVLVEEDPENPWYVVVPEPEPSEEV